MSKGVVLLMDSPQGMIERVAPESPKTTPRWSWRSRWTVISLQLENVGEGGQE